MTKDEAIYVLKNTAWLGWGDKQKENVTEAVQMAVEALQRETSGDAIDRQAAIRIASGYCHPANVAKELAKLPSVQPDVPDTNVGDMISRQPEPYEDAVSRHRLLNDLKELIAAWEKYPVMAEQIKGVEVAIGYVKTIPSVTPKPEPLSDAYMKAVWTWLLDYQIKAAKLKGRYTPYEVLSWVANDWKKEHE